MKARPIRVGLVLFAWLMASGSLWDVVQVFAWGRMYVLNLETQSMTEALAYTFSEDAMCGLCETVQVAKGSPREDTPTRPQTLEKISLLPIACIDQVVTPPPPRKNTSFRYAAGKAAQRSIKPVVPPPRIG